MKWAPPEDNGSTINAYEIEYRQHPGGTWSVYTTLDGTTHSFTMTGLQSGATYRIRMRARNANGWGAYSWPFAETTLNT